MNYKKFLINIALSALFCFLPRNSFSDVMFPEEKMRSFYVSAQYKVGVPIFKDFSVGETIPGLTKAVFAMLFYQDEYDITKANSFSKVYDPTYASSMRSFSGVIGHSFNNVRLELEGSYLNFQPEKQLYRDSSESYKYFMLLRENDQDFVVLKNNGVIDKSLGINFCYDVAKAVPLGPYVCTGIGVDYLKFLGVSLPKFSYQFKFGLGYPVNNNVILFGGGYYHNVIGSKYERAEIVYHPDVMKSEPKVTSAIANLNISYFGWELGVRFTL